MRKLLLVLIVGSLVWSMPMAASAQDCSGFAVPGDCPNPPDETSNCGCDWLEDFESYPLGKIAPGLNSWAGWFGQDGEAGEDDNRGTVTDSIADHTSGAGKCFLGQTGPPTSTTDQVHWFLGRGVGAGDPNDPGDGVGYDDDVSVFWIMEAWNFLPNGHTGDSFYILNSHYQRVQNDPDSPSGTSWHVQMELNSGPGTISNTNGAGSGATLPLVKDQWVKLRAEINFEADLVLLFYNDQFLDAFRWAADNGELSDALFLGNLDLFNNAGTDTFWDDISIVAAAPPTTARPSLECFPKGIDANRCADFMFRIKNNNQNDPIAQFFLDIEAGNGGRNETCRGTASSITAITPPPGWTVTNCTSWNSGHVLFRFDANSPADEIPVGQSVTGSVRTDTHNLLQEADGSDFLSATGTEIAQLSIVMTAAQFLGNEAGATCSSGDFSFGPTEPGLQEWSLRSTCTQFLPAPAVSTWGKLALAMLLAIGGTVLVVRSRKIVAA